LLCVDCQGWAIFGAGLLNFGGQKLSAFWAFFQPAVRLVLITHEVGHPKPIFPPPPLGWQATRGFKISLIINALFSYLQFRQTFPLFYCE
jgi:hypothetical protein